MHLLDKSKYIIFICLSDNALSAFEASENIINDRAVLKFLSLSILGILKKKTCAE